MSALEITKQVLSDFSSRTEKERPFIVALDGLSGAGKTTIAEEAGKELTRFDCKPLIIYIDNYIEAREKRYDTGRKEWEEYYYLQWDTEKLVRDLFKPLYGGE